jgi:hypothetical protein
MPFDMEKNAMDSQASTSQTIAPPSMSELASAKLHSYIMCFLVGSGYNCPAAVEMTKEEAARALRELADFLDPRVPEEPKRLDWDIAALMDSGGGDGMGLELHLYDWPRGAGKPEISKIRYGGCNVVGTVADRIARHLQHLRNKSLSGG